MSMVAVLLEGRIDATATNGVPFYVGGRRVTFLGANDRAGGARVQTQYQLHKGQGRCPLDPGAHNFGFAGVAL
jgi:hypothetical protein